MRLRTVEDVKQALAARLGKPPREDIWADLVNDRWPDEVLVDPDALDGLVEKYRQKDRIYRHSLAKGEPPKRVELPPDRRLLTFAQVIALEASRRPEVKAFREEVLGGHLLRPEEVADWIRRQARQDGEPSASVTIVLPFGLSGPDWETKMAEALRAVADFAESGAPEKEPPWRITVSTGRPLSCKVDGREVYPVPVNEYGVLGRLREIGEKLAEAYGWEHGEAVAFVLTGIAPEIPEAVGWGEQRPGQPPTIHMSVNPRMSSREVAGFYAHLRKAVFQGADHPMSEKRLALALFAAEHAEERHTWAALQAKWNRAHPEWSYTDWRRFARDTRAAWNKVTGRKWQARNQPRPPSKTPQGATWARGERRVPDGTGAGEAGSGGGHGSDGGGQGNGRGHDH